MKYLFTLSILFILGCSPIKYYPDQGTIRFYSSGEPYKCDSCKENTYLYKVMSNKKIICDLCFRKVERIKKLNK